MLKVQGHPKKTKQNKKQPAWLKCFLSKHFTARNSLTFEFLCLFMLGEFHQSYTSKVVSRCWEKQLLLGGKLVFTFFVSPGKAEIMLQSNTCPQVMPLESASVGSEDCKSKWEIAGRSSCLLVASSYWPK